MSAALSLGLRCFFFAVGSSRCPDSELVKVLRIRDCTVLIPTRMSIPISAKFGKHCQRRGKEEWKGGRLGRNTEKCLLSASMTWDLHSLTHSCGYLQAIKPVSIPACMGEGSRGSSPSWEAIDGWWLLRGKENQSPFFRHVASSGFTRLRWIAS